VGFAYLFLFFAPEKHPPLFDSAADQQAVSFACDFAVPPGGLTETPQGERRHINQITQV
jgi:hypothetical protein